jgi:hypothetical protein
VVHRLQQGDSALKHFHYCPKCHMAPPCEQRECAILADRANAHDHRSSAFSHHSVCDKCATMELADVAGGHPRMVETFSQEWFDIYNGIRR